MNRFSAFLAIVFALLAGLASGDAMAENPPSAMGYWEGQIDYPGASLGFNVGLLHAKGGEWAGVISLPAQGIRDLRLTAVSVDGSSVTFGVQGINGDPVFTGELSADGQEISGSLAQVGRTFPFSLRRSAEPPEPSSKIYAPYEKAGVPGAGLPGRWLGLLVLEPARVRMVMTITQAEDGSLSGTMMSPDQGDKEAQIDSMSLDGNSLSMSLSGLMAAYHAELSADGSELRGTWEQTGKTMTLDFKRQAESGK